MQLTASDSIVLDTATAYESINKISLSRKDFTLKKEIYLESNVDTNSLR